MALSAKRADVLAYRAGADLRTHQGKFVKRDGSGNIILCSAVTDRPLGILENTPNTGEQADVRRRGVGKVIASAAIARDDIVGTTATGLAVTLAGGAVAPGVPYAGYAESAVSGANLLVELFIHPGYIG